jgi:hypothetical protein
MMPIPQDDRDAREAARQDLERDESASRDSTDDRVEPNPPHTHTDKGTFPKFGSAGSGGAELEPGPPRP